MPKLTKRQENAIAWLVAGLLVLSALAGVEIVNVLVSLEYETDGPGECISQVTHADLCQTLWLTKAVCVGSLLVALLITLVAWLTRPRPEPE